MTEPVVTRPVVSGKLRKARALLAAVASARGGGPRLSGVVADDRVGLRVSEPSRRTLPAAGRVSVPSSGPGLCLEDEHVVLLIICQTHVVLVWVRERRLVLRHAHVVRVIVGVVLAITVTVAVVTVRVYTAPVPCEEELDVVSHLQVLYVPSQSVPSEVTVLQSLLHEGGRAEVDVVDDVMERGGIGDRKMDDRMGARGRGEDAREPKRGGGRLGRQTCERRRRRFHREVERRGTAQETTEERRVGTQVIHVQLGWTSEAGEV